MIERDGIEYPDAWRTVGAPQRLDGLRGSHKKRETPDPIRKPRTVLAITDDAQHTLNEQLRVQERRWKP